MSLRNPAGAVADRIGSTLFLAALAHGIVILGVTFTASPLESHDALPSLNVTLLVESAEQHEPPESSSLIATRNQRGSGEAAPGMRPTAAPADSQLTTRPGDVRAADAADGMPRLPADAVQQLLTSGPADRRVDATPRAHEQPAAVPMRQAALLASVALPALTSEVDVRTELPQQNNRELLVSPSTRESALAPYLDSWRRQVERIGTANFPTQFRGQAHTARPVLEVAIDRDGRLREIIVRRSSGDGALDQAALTILRLAAPFDALPAEIRARYDVLRFAYEWDFFGGTSGAP